MTLRDRWAKLQWHLLRRFGPRHALPLWWHVGRPNFGDDINPTYFDRVMGRPVRFEADRSRPHLLGAGSILDRATDASVVCGAGLVREPRRIVTAAEFVAVRGALSLAACARPEGVVLGDPLVLVDAFVEPVDTRHRFGFVPHATSVGRWKRLNARGRHVIDPGGPPWGVVKQIAACEVVFSQSLHGLIVADALGIPNVWVAPSEAMVGGRFKFDDYFSTLDRAKEPVPESRDLFAHPRRYGVSVGTYRFSKDDYRRALVAACTRLGDGLAAGA